MMESVVNVFNIEGNTVMPNVLASKNIVVKQVKPNIPVFDVFTGDGWMNWTRMSWNNKTKRLAIEVGERLNPFELKEVYNQVEILLHHG